MTHSSKKPTLIEVSKARTIQEYTNFGSFENPEKCSVCDVRIEIGEQVLRCIDTKKIICKPCVNAVINLAA